MVEQKHYIFSQRNGHFCLDDGELIGVGYAGASLGKNNPEMQDVKNSGPLPRGWYTIEGPFDSEHTGKMVFRLIPDKENKMFGRGDFELHGDSIDRPGTASKGCIVQGRVVRTFVRDNLETIKRILVVV
jgi:hypothetical protein